MAKTRAGQYSERMPKTPASRVESRRFDAQHLPAQLDNAERSSAGPVAPDAVTASAPPAHDFGQLPMSSLESLPGQPALQAKVESRENRTGMPDRLKNGLESLSGMDLSSVRVHRNSDKPAQVQALAYTQGQNIHVAPGQDKHLPHEGWHAVQQMAGRVQPTIKAHGVAINDSPGLENEADVMGRKAMQTKA